MKQLGRFLRLERARKEGEHEEAHPPQRFTTLENAAGAPSVTTHSGAVLTLPPSYVLDEPTWDKLEVAKREDQDAIARLTAENRSFRLSAADWKPSWWILAGATATGIVIGWYAHEHL